MKQPSSWWRSTSPHQLTFQVRAPSQPRWAPVLLGPPPAPPHPMETALAIGEAKGRKTPKRGIRSLRCLSARGPLSSTTDTVWRSPTQSSSAPRTPEPLHASRYTWKTCRLHLGSHVAVVAFRILMWAKLQKLQRKTTQHLCCNAGWWRRNWLNNSWFKFCCWNSMLYFIYCTSQICILYLKSKSVTLKTITSKLSKCEYE